MGRAGALTLLLAAASVHAADWASLERHQQTITRTEFDKQLTALYCPTGTITNYLSYTTNAVTVFSTPAKTKVLFTLRFAGTPIPALAPTFIHRVVLDPGHIGGEWARVEERWFVRGTDRPVQEAVLNLTVARLLQTRLEAAGITVFLTKNDLQPVTNKRPEDLRADAEAWGARLTQFNAFPPLEREAARADAIRKHQEILFYRTAEIAARVRKINEELKPDLTLCLHFNAVGWNECRDLVNDNRLTVFVHGNYLPDEVADDEQKFCLFSKLLERNHTTELTVADSIANSLARATGLAPVPPSENSTPAGPNSFLLARNLAANRLTHGPVVFLEPYYQNNRIVYQRIQLGDYAGTREIEGKSYKSIYQEYANAVAEGLLKYLAQAGTDSKAVDSCR